MAAGKLQVIVKIVDYELGSANPVHPIGAWHVEGMSHENIACSAVCVLRNDESIQGGELLFKRAFNVDEWKDFKEGAEEAPQMEGLHAHVSQELEGYTRDFTKE